MEEEIIQHIRDFFDKDLISLFVEGSYATHDFVEEYSDYDLLALVRDYKKFPNIDLSDLSKKYSVNIQCDIRPLQDLINRIKNNNKATRFINNLRLIKIKKQSRLLAGKNIKNLVPNVKEIVKRDLYCELRADYYHATNSNPAWNIYRREPRHWVNYIINMGNNLLLSKGIVVKKSKIPEILIRYCHDFKGTSFVKKALILRKTKRVLNLNKTEKNQLRKELTLFLEEYKSYTF